MYSKRTATLSNLTPVMHKLVSALNLALSNIRPQAGKLLLIYDYFIIKKTLVFYVF